MVGIDHKKLKLELRRALECSVHLLAQKTDLKNICTFGLYTSEELNYVSATANESPRSTQTKFLWSPPDWKYHTFADQSCFLLVETEMLKGWDEDFLVFQVDKDLVFGIFIDVLTELRLKYFSGTNVLVGVFMGSMGHEMVASSISRINPPYVAKLFSLDKE